MTTHRRRPPVHAGLHRVRLSRATLTSPGHHPVAPAETDLRDDRAAGELLRQAFPPLRGDAAALFIPSVDGRSERGVLCLVDDVPERASTADAEQALRCFAGAAAHLGPGAGLLVAVQRRGEAGPRDTDVVWLHTARAVCAGLGVELLGVWLVAGRAAPLRLDGPPGAALALDVA